jgi:hypothetical protein
MTHLKTDLKHRWLNVRVSRSSPAMSGLGVVVLCCSWYVLSLGGMLPMSLPCPLCYSILSVALCKNMQVRVNIANLLLLQWLLQTGVAIYRSQCSNRRFAAFIYTFILFAELGLNKLTPRPRSLSCFYIIVLEALTQCVLLIVTVQYNCKISVFVSSYLVWWCTLISQPYTRTM